jgi:hypothetical protein
MVFNDMRATLLRWWEMSWAARTQLKAWMQQAASFNEIEPEAFNDPLLRIAEVRNAQGDPVAFCPVQTCLLINGYAVGPHVTPEAAHQAGNLIDSMLEFEGQRMGVSKLLIAIPADHSCLQESDLGMEFKEYRVYERHVPASFAVSGVGLFDSTPVMKFIN